mmetsp:Transcript_15339/g.43484  ORF Transcript_15339/g.43484 Transcript_15339/m.43484 type:complete len:238 (+) Transcript_15339:612-1325(+)
MIMPSKLTAVSCEPSLAWTSAVFPFRAKCTVMTARVAPAATPQAALSTLAVHTAPVKQSSVAFAQRSGDASSSVSARSTATSAKSRQRFTFRSKYGALFQAKMSPPNIPTPSRYTHWVVAASALAERWPTPSPSRMARVESTPRRYEHSAWRESKAWNCMYPSRTLLGYPSGTKRSYKVDLVALPTVAPLVGAVRTARPCSSPAWISATRLGPHRSSHTHGPALPARARTSPCCPAS